MILPTDEDATLPLYCEEALDQPTPQVSTQAPSILCGRLAAVWTVRRDRRTSLRHQL
jgi:hypothetical protein